MYVSAFNNDDRGGHLYKENVVEVHNNESVFFTTMSSFLLPTLKYKQSAKHKANRVKGSHYVSTNLL